LLLRRNLPQASARDDGIAADYERLALRFGLPAFGGEMKTYIALLRGINVGGAGTLSMKELVAILESLDCRHVRTYIQSGNAVFQRGETDTAKLAKELTAKIAKQRDFAPHVLILDAKALQRVVDANPFPEAMAEPKSLHAFFLDTKPAQSALKSLESLKGDSERFELRGRVLYLYAPDGVGRSKLAASVERKLGVTATARNWRTVTKLLEMVGMDEVK
jgi:uncharacterized protein (DUF1697 family)